MSLEEELAAELSWLLRAGIGSRSLRIAARELVTSRLAEGPLGPVRVTETVRCCLMAAGRVARESDTPREQLLELVMSSALEGVRGQGGETSRWLEEARRAAWEALAELQALAQRDRELFP